MLLRKRIREMYGNLVPGCVFYVTRNGRPFADGSFGDARRPGSPDGQIAMSASSLVHIASIGKVICIVAILRLMQEWNRILGQPAKSGEPKLDQTAHASGVALNFGTKVFPLLKSFLDGSLIASYPSFPGQNVRNITIGQLLGHTSDLAQGYDDADLNGLPHDDVEHEPQGEGTSHIDLPKAVTALLRHDAIPPVTDPPTPPNQYRYNNAGYTVLGAVIEATTGAFYTDWVQQRLLSDPRFADISRKVVDPLRSARYYQRDDNGVFSGGVHHPNYTSWSADGGWYVSAAAFCEWVEAVMRKEPVDGWPILDHPEVLLKNFNLGVAPYSVGRLRGFEKNGGATPGGGSTNCRFAYLEGYGTERVCGFAEANANINANALLDVGFAALAEYLSHRPLGVTISDTVMPGLFQTVYFDDHGMFDDHGIVKSPSQSAPVSVRSVPVGGVTANRTDLLGSGSLPGLRASSDPITPSDPISLELTGFIQAVTTGSYGFRLTSDDGSFLWIDDDLVADNSGDHAPRCMESDPVWMEGGAWYPIRVRLHNASGGSSLYLEWRTPGASLFDAIPTTHFVPHG